MTRFGALFTRESLCACSALIDIPAAPRRPDQDQECCGRNHGRRGRGGQSAFRSEARNSLVIVGGGAGHPIATIYFPSAARNTSGQEERKERERGRRAVDRELINDIRRGRGEARSVGRSIELCAHLTSFYNCRLLRGCFSWQWLPWLL